MEMEHINENTIRVLIGADDLEERGITFLDLLGNQKQVETFFYNILEELDVQDSFRESEAVTFQVMPRGTGLELYITKGSPTDAIANMEFGFEDSGVLEHVAQFIRQHLSRKREEQAKSQPAPTQPEEPVLQDIDCIFRTDDFEALIHLAQNMRLACGTTSVYSYKNAYYLIVSFTADELATHDVDDAMLEILEFVDMSQFSADILREHGKLLIADNALTTLQQHFTK